MSDQSSSCIDVFLACQRAMVDGRLIVRSSRGDKEFPFQDWFGKRLEDEHILFEQGGRNSYPDFRLVQRPEGYELKGLAWPGRDASFDANSQVPTGVHNGRTIFYVFGRYPASLEDNEYPVVDLVVCHGDFLNADHTYVHKNKSVKGFGSYGDFLIRDRKMYVCPTPFVLTHGTTGRRTLILPADFAVDERLEVVGQLVRVEADRLVTGYQFDLRTNELRPEFSDNPSAGMVHDFVAYRATGEAGTDVTLLARTDVESAVDKDRSVSD